MSRREKAEPVPEPGQSRPSCCVPREGLASAPPSALTTDPPDLPSRNPRSTRGQVRVPAGSFEMGDAFDEGYPDDGETPVHTVTLASFFIDATTVTNAGFATFAKATGYETEAERFGSSAVFHLAVPA